MTASGLGPLAALARAAPDAAVLTDFDGTLAPIVPDPATARPLPEATAVLRALAERFAAVGVVSGRPAAFLLEHLGHAGPGVQLVGLYGLERVRHGEVEVAPVARPWLDPVAEVAAAARREAPAGVGVEPKGAALALHWRGAADPDGCARWAWSFAARAQEATGLHPQPGRRALELRPPLAVDKGSVVDELADGRAAACFLGDDAGDLPAFAALERLAHRGLATVKVAVADVESPGRLVADADVVVDGPEEALDLLRRLAAAAS